MILFPTSLTLCCFFSCLGLVKVLWMLSQLLWVYMFVFPIVCDAISLESSTTPALTIFFLAPILHRSINLDVKALIKLYLFRLSVPRLLSVCTLSSVGLCINYHLLQEEVSLMRATDVMMYEYSNLLWWVNFLVCTFRKIIDDYYLGYMIYLVSGSWLH